MNRETATRPDVTTSRTPVPGTRNEAANAHVVGSDTHHNGSRNSGGHQNHRVSATCTPCVTE
jgi:hypothetical protein